MKQKRDYEGLEAAERRGQVAAIVRRTIGSSAKIREGSFTLPPSNLDLIAAARKGLHKSALRSLCETFEIMLSDLEPILSVSKRSLQRYEAQGDKVLPKPLSDHILQLLKVYERALEVFGTREKALEWLKSPIVALGHQIPFSLLDTSAGIEMVMAEFVRIDHGIVA